MGTHAAAKRRSRRRGRRSCGSGTALGRSARCNQSHVRNILRGPALQARLTVGPSDDAFEQEADRIADQVMQSSAPPQSAQDDGNARPAAVGSAGDSIRRKASEKEINELLTRGPASGRMRQDLRRKPVRPPAASQHRSPGAGVGLEGAVRSLRGQGRPLPLRVRSFMESRFGAGFDDVRIHDDEKSTRLSRMIRAQAFTWGNEIFFDRRHYNPDSDTGRHLLAHELVHTLQQSRTREGSGAKSDAGASRIQRANGDADLTSARFSGNRILENVLDDKIELNDGSRGRQTNEAVELIQNALLDLGYVLPDHGADGLFGDETERAVKAFQIDTGAQVDGIVGDQTMGFLDARDAGRGVAPPPAPVVANAAFNAANAIAQPGAAPSRPIAGLGACTYGFTFPENVGVDISVIRNGANWQPVLTGVTGNYSLQARLIPAAAEVTGPGGNTTQANFCAQATDLDNLGFAAGGGCAVNWYMLSAVVAHERVHAEKFRPALVAAAIADLETSLEAIRVPFSAAVNTQAAAEAAVRAHPDFAAALTQAQSDWLTEILTRVVNDHNAGGATDSAEREIVDPMIRRICRHARANRWGACAACPP